MGESFNGIMWSIGTAGLAGLTGTLVDHIAGPLLDQNIPGEYPGVKAGAQFAVSILAISELTQRVIPANSPSPIGDGLLMYMLFQSQPNFRRNFDLFLSRVRDMIGVDNWTHNLSGAVSSSSSAAGGHAPETGARHYAPPQRKGHYASDAYKR